VRSCQPFLITAHSAGSGSPLGRATMSQRRQIHGTLVLGVATLVEALAAPVGAGEGKAPPGSKKQPGWELRAVLKKQQGSLAPLAFSPDGKTLAVTGADEGGAAAVLKLWDVSAAKPTLRHSLAGHKEAVTCLAFSPNGK